MSLQNLSFFFKISLTILVPLRFYDVKLLSCVRLFAIPWAVAYQAPPSMEFSGKSTGVGCHFLLQGIFPIWGLNPGLPHCRQTLYSEPPGKPI